MSWDTIFSPDTSLFTSFMLIYFFYFWYFLRVSKNKFQLNFVLAAPSGLASIGVLGTFFGIFIGLSEFDTSDMQSSVPKLLDGMKTAFVTSILGLVFSLLAKLLQMIKAHDLQKEVSKNKQPTLMELLIQTNQQNKILLEEIRKISQPTPSLATGSIPSAIVDKQQEDSASQATSSISSVEKKNPHDSTPE